MVPAVLTLVLSTMVGAGAHVPDAVVLQALPPLVDGVVTQALPPPPQKVIIETRYYGSVTVDHAAHLARRASCARCHGAGRVSKIEFTPKLAHERCKSCHSELQRGPTQCRGCHLISPALAEKLHLAGAAPAGGTTAGPATEAVAVKPAALEGGPPTTAARPLASHAMTLGDAPVRREMRHALELGASAGDRGTGAVLRVSFREDNALLTESVERLSGGPVARTFVLMGAGMALPIRDRWDVTAAALGGVDAVDRPTTAFLPAVGARLGVEYFVRRWLVEMVHLSVTGSYDLTRRDFNGSPVGGTTLFLTLTTGLRMTSSR